GLIHPEPGAEFLPIPALAGRAVYDLAGLDGQLLRVGADARSDLLEQVLQRRLGAAQGGRGLRRAGGAATGAGRVAQVALADLQMDVLRLQAEDLRDDDGRHRPLAGAQILGRGLGGHAAVAADGDVALVRLAALGEATPGVDRHAQAVLDRARPRPPPRLVPLLLPAGELDRDVELLVVEVVPP